MILHGGGTQEREFGYINECRSIRLYQMDPSSRSRMEQNNEELNHEEQGSQAETIILLSDDDEGYAALNDMQEIIDSVAEVNMNPVMFVEDEGFYENVRYLQEAETQTDHLEFLDIDISEQDVQHILDVLGITQKDFSTLDNINCNELMEKAPSPPTSEALNLSPERPATPPATVSNDDDYENDEVCYRCERRRYCHHHRPSHRSHRSHRRHRHRH
ncbi:uncharacterized protein LOC122509739 [Leptopilina heterotoma]|uniref:uncharacterized protein LOC122509739 n=1 Tax=Leptopilina heterotoma TaxID=63436 RepID=UPI001CA8067C|nr:uncharacterized protein LOC122509739 [Leptopilina heterotoma]